MILVYLGGRFSLIISKLFPICMFARQNSETFWPIVLPLTRSSIHRSAAFLALDFRQLEALISSQWVRRLYNSEATLFEGVMNWVEADADSRKQHLVHLLQGLRIDGLSPTLVANRW